MFNKKLNCQAPQCGYWHEETGCSINDAADNGREICEKGEGAMDAESSSLLKVVLSQGFVLTIPMYLWRYWTLTTPAKTPRTKMRWTKHISVSKRSTNYTIQFIEKGADMLKEIQKLRDKYQEPLFRMALYHMISKGYEHFTDELVADAKKAVSEGDAV